MQATFQTKTRDERVYPLLDAIAAYELKGKVKAVQEARKHQMETLQDPIAACTRKSATWPCSGPGWTRGKPGDGCDDQVAVAEVDRFGNPVAARDLRIPLEDRRKEQVLAAQGDAVAGVVAWARTAGKPVVRVPPGW